MTKHNILFIGLDTHKEFVEVAMKDLKDAKYQLKALLLRNNINYAVRQIGH